jgi:hypothetical protein
LVAAGGFVAAAGFVAAGVLVAAGALVGTGGFVTSGTESNESGHLEIGSESEVVARWGMPSLMVEDGGQAGIECSVGGSGGQMSISSGMAPWAGAASS